MTGTWKENKYIVYLEGDSTIETYVNVENKIYIYIYETMILESAKYIPSKKIYKCVYMKKGY